MRLAFVFSSLELSGGVLLVVEYANRLAQRGHTLTLVYPAASAAPEVLAMLDPVVRLQPAGSSLVANRSPLGWLRLAASLARAIPPVDVVIATHTPTVAPVLLHALPRRQRRAWLYMDYEEMFRSRPIERRLLHAAPRWFEVIMTISQPLASAVRADHPRRVVVTGSGLARAGYFMDQPRLPHPPGAIHLFYLGDSRPRKGLADVIAALHLLQPTYPTLRLIIASKEALSIDPSIPHELYVHPDDAQLSALYRSSDLFVSASWGEGLGYPPLEAMACGAPVVTTASGGVDDYARDGENCLIVPPRNPAALADAIARLLSDPELAASLVTQGYITAGRFRWDAVIDRVEAALAPTDGANSPQPPPTTCA